jgi:acetyl esterase
MTAAATVVPTAVPPITGWRKAILPAFVACVRASLRVSPRPMAFLIRKQFARGGVLTKEELDRHAPAGIATFADERYGDGPDALLDVYVPDTAQRTRQRLSVIVWIHGGGWIGGDKGELAGYMKLLAARGFVAVAINYSLAPAARYPTPVRQTMVALRFVADNAARFSIDPSRVFLGGDSAGAQIAAQVAALATNPAYVRAVGVAPTIDPARLRGVALCCGPYDPALADDDAPFHGFLTTILWSYSGTRDWRHNRTFSNVAVGGHLTAAFPPAFITVGNADPLAEHSKQLAAALSTQGVEVDALFFPDAYQPPLAHEYQFRLDGPDAQHAFGRLVAFLAGHA